MALLRWYLTVFLLCSVGCAAKAQVQADSLAQGISDSLTVRQIIILGHRVTKEAIIRRELDFVEGDRLSREGLDKFMEWERNKLYNTNLFVKVELRYVEEEPGYLLIFIELKEQWYIWPIPIFELADPNFNVWWNVRNRDLSRINYGLDLNWRNFRGRREVLRVVTQFGFTQRFQLLYRVPFLNRRKTLGLVTSMVYDRNLNIDYTTTDNKFVQIQGQEAMRSRRNFSAAITYRRNFFAQHELRTWLHDQQVADTIARLNPNYFLDGRKQIRFWETEYTFQHDRRDMFAYPLKGHYLMFNADYKHFFEGAGDIWELNLNASKYFALGSGWYYASGLWAKYSPQDRQPYATIGGFGYNYVFVRGFDIYAVEGPRYLLTRQALRKKLFAVELDFQGTMPIEQFQLIPVSAYLKAYWDAGQVQHPLALEANRVLANQWIHGGGIGLDLVTGYNLIFRFEYSYNMLQRGGFFFYIHKDI